MNFAAKKKKFPLLKLNFVVPCARLKGLANRWFHLVARDVVTNLEEVSVMTKGLTVFIVINSLTAKVS